MKINLSVGGISVGITSPVIYDILIDEKANKWERYEVMLQDFGLTNLLFGKNIKFDYWGQLVCKSHTTGQEFIVKFSKSEGLLQSASSKGRIDGILNDANNKPRYRLKGYWNGKDMSFDKYNEDSKQFENTKYLFKDVLVTDEEDYEWDINYRLNDYALNLNHLDDELAEKLPPTDTRFRPDIRAFENGYYEQAEVEKKRLETNQRERRKALGCEPPPKYFTKHVLDEKNKKYYFEFGGPRNYFEDRKNKDWDHLTKIYD
jgi:oxysterol-binding protein 1